MNYFEICRTLVPADQPPPADRPAVILLTSDELSRRPELPGLEEVLFHTPFARDARICKAEARPDCLCGTLVLPRHGKNKGRLCCGYLLAVNRVVLVDDENLLFPFLKRLAREKHPTNDSIGHFWYTFLEQLIARDLHALEEIEDRAVLLEEQVLSHQLENFSAPMTALRRDTMSFLRYYCQLDDVACELHENENGLFSGSEQKLFRLFEERVVRLREEAQYLREYCSQIQNLFQSEIDIRQNRIMQILTIVTTVFLPLSLLVGWYGMNFSGMPELHWKYGYPMIILVSALIVLLSLFICKKKKFW